MALYRFSGTPTWSWFICLFVLKEKCELYFSNANMFLSTHPLKILRWLLLGLTKTERLHDPIPSLPS